MGDYTGLPTYWYLSIPTGGLTYTTQMYERVAEGDYNYNHRYAFFIFKKNFFFNIYFYFRETYNIQSDLPADLMRGSHSLDV